MCLCFQSKEAIPWKALKNEDILELNLVIISFSDFFMYPFLEVFQAILPVRVLNSFSYKVDILSYICFKKDKRLAIFVSQKL